MKTQGKLFLIACFALMINGVFGQSDMQHNGTATDSMKTNRTMKPERNRTMQRSEGDSVRPQRTMQNNRVRGDSTNANPNNRMYNKNSNPSTVPPDSTHN